MKDADDNILRYVEDTIVEYLNGVIDELFPNGSDGVEADVDEIQDAKGNMYRLCGLWPVNISIRRDMRRSNEI
jgi:hypothetical protein